MIVVNTVLSIGFLGIALALTQPASADLADVDKAEQQARQAFIQRFGEFTQDKNVMGKPSLPNGTVIQGTKKTAFDKDGGGKLPFQSDLTYHDFVYNVEEEVNKNKNGAAPGASPNPNDTIIRTLFGFVSDHGKLSGAGGSSRLEREVYQLYNEYAEREEEERNKKARDEQEGIKFENIFKVTTQQVIPKNNAAAGGAGAGAGAGAAAGPGNKQDNEPEKVERREFRDEVAQKIDKVGEDSAETIFEAAREPGKEKDVNEMPNLTFLYEAAGRATKAMWNASLANLGQRRANRGVRGGDVGLKPQLNEGTPTCDAFVAQTAQDLQKEQDPNRRQQLQQDLNRISQQCKQMAALPYNVINPRFEFENNQGGGGGQPQEQLKTGDPLKEDPIQRDLRVQLEVMAKAGKSPTEVESNWQYSAKDETTTLNQYDENGQVVGKRQVTPKDQIEGYNALLEQAQQGYEEVKQRYPDLQVPNVTQYAIQPGSRSMMDINKATNTQMEEFGLETAPQEKTPETYEQMIQEGN